MVVIVMLVHILLKQVAVFFNLNLGRCFLFGGPDDELGEIHVGYFDPDLNQEANHE